MKSKLTCRQAWKEIAERISKRIYPETGLCHEIKILYARGEISPNVFNKMSQVIYKYKSGNNIKSAYCWTLTKCGDQKRIEFCKKQYQYNLKDALLKMASLFKNKKDKGYGICWDSRVLLDNDHISYETYLEIMDLLDKYRLKYKIKRRYFWSTTTKRGRDRRVSWLLSQSKKI